MNCPLHELAEKDIMDDMDDGDDWDSLEEDDMEDDELSLILVFVDSKSTPMLPFSPMRYDTSKGSTQMVSSLGIMDRMTVSLRPQECPACRIRGSILWLMRMHRNPLPLFGLEGNQ